MLPHVLGLIGFHLIEQAIDPIRKELDISIVFVALLYQKACLPRSVIFVACRVYSYVRLIITFIPC